MEAVTQEPMAGRFLHLLPRGFPSGRVLLDISFEPWRRTRRPDGSVLSLGTTSHQPSALLAARQGARSSSKAHGLGTASAHPPVARRAVCSVRCSGAIRAWTRA